MPKDHKELSPADVAQIGRYGADSLADCPAFSPKQRRELEALAADEDEQDDEDQLDETPTNQAIRRLAAAEDGDEDATLPAWLGKALREEPMTASYTDDELHDCLHDMLDKLDEVDGLPTFRAQMGKALREVCDDVALQHMSSRQLRGQVGSMQKAIATVYQDGRANRRAVRSLAQAFDRLCQGLLALERKTPPSPLTKAVAEFLPAEGVPFSKALEVTKAVVQAFGPRGGQRVPYDRELCATLRLCKSLSPDEERRWQQFHRLPDHVNIQNPQASPHWQHDADARIRVGHLLSQVSPLFLAGLRLR
jgi:hypothetical protein